MWCRKQRPKLWSNVALVGDGLSSMMSNFYWGVSIVELIESILGQSPEDSTDSKISVYVGMIFSVAAIGAAITQRELNIYMHSSAAVTEDLETPLTQKPINLPPLTSLQIIALASLAFTNTGDVSGAISAGVDLITTLALKTTMSLQSKLALQCSATLFGATAAVANVNSCKRAMKENAAKKNDPVVPAPNRRNSSVNDDTEKRSSRPGKGCAIS
jgi:hypothetical protein